MSNPNNAMFGMAPIRQVVAVTPGLSFNNGLVSRGFMVNAAGNISIVDTCNNTVVLNVLAGQIYWIAVTSVNASGTTATGIFALY